MDVVNIIASVASIVGAGIAIWQAMSAKSAAEIAVDAKKEGLTLVANSTFRTYATQEKTYNYYKTNKGSAYADSYAARPGHSEHQTGLAIDISTLNSTSENFEDTPEFNWLIDNAYKYGFILRYPENKEHLTGFDYESWHYRFVGLDVAKKIHEENITFDAKTFTVAFN